MGREGWLGWRGSLVARKRTLYGTRLNNNNNKDDDDEDDNDNDHNINNITCFFLHCLCLAGCCRWLVATKGQVHQHRHLLIPGIHHAQPKSQFLKDLGLHAGSGCLELRLAQRVRVAKK